jgi:hypothetical protein
MERIFQGVITTLSFLAIIMFCTSGDVIPEPTPKPTKVITPMIQSVQFERVPALVSVGAKNEKQYNWKNSERP